MENDLIVGDVDMQTVAVAQEILGCTMEQAAMTVAYACVANCTIVNAHTVLYGTHEQKTALWIRARC